MNNRDPGTLERDGGTVGRTEAPLPRIPLAVLAISESELASDPMSRRDLEWRHRACEVLARALDTAADVTWAVAAGADAVLVGTALARSADPAAQARELLRAARAGGAEGAS